jgi:hypothetical protein
VERKYSYKVNSGKVAVNLWRENLKRIRLKAVHMIAFDSTIRLPRRKALKWKAGLG